MIVVPGRFPSTLPMYCPIGATDATDGSRLVHVVGSERPSGVTSPSARKWEFATISRLGPATLEKGPPGPVPADEEGSNGVAASLQAADARMAATRKAVKW